MAAKVQGNEGQDPGAPQGSTGETRTMRQVRAQPPPPRPLMAGEPLQSREVCIPPDRKVYIPPEGRIEDLQDAGVLLTSEQLEVYSKIGPVLNHCSPDQVEHIFGLFAEVEAAGEGPKVAAWQCRRKIGEFLIGSVLDDCEDYQIGHILNYFADMITDGNKATFATQVCESMAILYRNDIESFLPIEYDVENDKMWIWSACPEELDQGRIDQYYLSGYYNEGDELCYYTEQTEEMQELNPIYVRMDSIHKLASIMTDNNADYRIIRLLLEKHQIGQIEGELIFLRGYLLSQRTQGIDELRASYRVKGFDVNQLINKFETMSLRERSKFEKSIVMYKAFTAIVLKHVKIPGIVSRENDTCLVRRGFYYYNDMRASYPQAIGNRGVRDYVDGIPDEIVASTSIGRIRNSFIGRGEEFGIHEMHMPFSRIFAVYFMSPELSIDYTSPIVTRHRGVIGGVEVARRTYKENEVVCDCSNIRSQIVSLPRPETE